MLKFFKRRKRIAKIENVQDKLESCSCPVIESLEGRQFFSIPAAPFALAGAAKSDTQVYLAWHDNSWDETGFRIERCNGVGCINFRQIATVTTNVSSYSNTGLKRNTSYTYRARTYNSAGASAYSNTATAKTPRK